MNPDTANIGELAVSLFVDFAHAAYALFMTKWAFKNLFVYLIIKTLQYPSDKGILPL